MSALVFFVRHRSVDLVGMTAAAALRDRMGLRDRLLALRRDEIFVLEAPDLGDSKGWLRSFSRTTHWFNPNKHRFALYAAQEGAIAAAQTREAWPQPWIGAMLHSDRPDLVAADRPQGLASWQALPKFARSQQHAILSWDLESGVTELPPAGDWPLRSSVRLLRAQLWSASVRAESAAEAKALVEGFALTRTRTQGLLVHPHVEGWSSVA